MCVCVCVSVCACVCVCVVERINHAWLLICVFLRSFYRYYTFFTNFPLRRSLTNTRVQFGCKSLLTRTASAICLLVLTAHSSLPLALPTAVSMFGILRRNVANHSVLWSDYVRTMPELPAVLSFPSARSWCLFLGMIRVALRYWLSSYIHYNLILAISIICYRSVDRDKNHKW